MIMMRSTSAQKTGKPPPPVPPRPSKVNVSDSLTRTKRLAPDVPTKPTVPYRSAPPPPTSRVYQLREAFNGDNNTENKIHPIVKSQSYSAVNFGIKPNLERSISQDGNKKSRTVIFESPNLKSTVEITRKESDKHVEKVEIIEINGTDEKKENNLDTNRNEIRNESGYSMDVMHEMLADAIKKDMDEENKTKIKIENEEDEKKEEPKATVLVIEDDHAETNETQEIKDNDLILKDSEDEKSNSSTGERKKVKFDDKLNHELLIDELQNMKMEQERILKRQRKPSKDIYEIKEQPKILHSDWIEVNDGEEVRLSSCKITIDERGDTKDPTPTTNSVDPLISRLSTMSNLHGLPPLPKSLSNFNFLEGSQTPNRSSTRNTTPPVATNTSSHLVYPPHPKPVVNGGSQANGSNLDTQLAILRREMVEVYKTGGGTASKPTLDDTKVRLLNLLKPQMEPLKSNFDSSAEYFGDNIITEEIDFDIVEVEEGDVNEPSTSTQHLPTSSCAIAASTPKLQDGSKKRKLVDVYDCVRDYTKVKSAQYNDINIKAEVEMEILNMKKKKMQIQYEEEREKLEQEKLKTEQEKLKMEQEKLKMEQEKLKVKQETVKLEIQEKLLRNNIGS